MPWPVLLTVAGLCAAAGVVMLRLAWQRKRRSRPLNVTGWSLFILAILSAWLAAGAWGEAMFTWQGNRASANAADFAEYDQMKLDFGL